MTTAGVKRGKGSTPARPAGPLVWLAYLLLYFVPWAFVRPGPRSLIASAIGVGLFLIVFFDANLGRRRSVMPHVIAMAAIGFALEPFGVTWSVFNVFASSLAAKLPSRRTAVFTLIALQLSLVAAGLALHLPWIGWVSGVFFGTMAGFGVLLQSNLELKNAQLLEAQDEVRALSATAERERISRDLHDLLGHTLTLVAVKADLAARLVSRDPDAALREMQEVAASAREALGEVRTAVVGMRGATLSAELERVQRMLAAANIATEVSSGPGDADPAREAVLAMALREAVTNVIRHADARHCNIGLASSERGDLELSVSDDGRGGRFEEGSGLLGMRARLAAAGGALLLQSGPEGTTLLARLPRAVA